MSTTRKLRPAGGDRERERRHMAWLNRADNGERIATQSAVAYAEQGRGFWFASERLSGEPGFTRAAYIPAANLADLPAGQTRDVVARMIATYNPARQVVVVIEDDGEISAYKVRPVQIDPRLN